MLLWYTVATFALVGVTIAAVYFALAFHQDREVDATLSRDAGYWHAGRDYPMDDFEEWVYRPTRIIDASGRTRAESSQMVRLFPVTSFPAPGVGGTDRKGSDGRLYRLRAVQIDGWIYQQAQDRTPENALMARFRRNVALAALPMLVVSLVVGYSLARRGLRPMKEIIASARAISPTFLAGRVPAHGLPAELQELADTLNGSLDRMHEAFTRLDQFSADVAHELRTPVHNLKGGIEVALSQDRTPDEYRNALTSSLNEADRLGRLVDRLLFLAQAEDPRREVRRETCDLVLELEEIKEFFSPAATEAGVSLEVAEPRNLSVSVDRSLFQRAVSNLVSNALAHTSAGGIVRVTASGDENGLCVIVTDTGIGIHPDDLPQLFDRYYRSKSARDSGRGVGLGLAIVRRIVELHGGKVDVQSERNVGTAVRMIFP
jgi:two-component system heavy metal sensor histidine kinase CusS